MSIRGVMRNRIAQEMRRGNLDLQIDNAITTAIEAYQGERWLFQITRAITFQTEAGTEFYGGDDLSDLVQIDYVKIIIGDTPYTLEPAESAAVMETLSNSATTRGQPSEYLWYGEQIRLYPVPDAEYTVRVAGVYKARAPLDDDEADNPWMTAAERLIRSRAKWELALHVLYDDELATRMAAATEEAYADLKRQMTRKLATGRVAAMPY